MTRRERILEEITAKLRRIQDLQEAVYRSRTDALTRDESPAVIVEPIADLADQSTLSRLDWSLQVRVSVVVRSDAPQQFADPYVEKIHSKLMEDLSLGGLTIDIQPVGVGFQALGADQAAGIVEMDFRILYKTDLKNLTTL